MNGSPVSILVVDDMPENIAVLSGVLSPFYQVKAATTAKKAFSICGSGTLPDLILLDVMMPDIDGYEACRQLKASERTRDVPVIFVTAVTDPKGEAEGFEAGAVDYITKPISPPVVLQRVKLHLELAFARKKIEDLNQQYSSYISPRLARCIDNGEITAAIGSRRKNLTVFFSDIEQFTAQTERMEPEVMSFVLNYYFDVMTQIVHKYKGTLDKYIGDAMLVFFGDPETLGPGEDAKLCLNMAVEMQNAVDSIQEVWKAHGCLIPLRVRIGITSGECAVGNFGSSSQHSYTILGTPVNLASRLQSLARPGTIWICDSTHQLVQDNFECIPQAPARVKGLSYEIHPYEVVTSPE